MVREFPAAPIAGVGGVVIDQDRVLLIRRGQEPLLGRWSIPGGAVELGETLEHAVQRELLEETGIEVEVLEVLEVLDKIVIDPESNAVRYHYVLIDFLCRLRGGQIAPASDAADARWVAFRDLERGKSVELEPAALRVIEKAFALSAAWARSGSSGPKETGSGSSATE